MKKKTQIFIGGLFLSLVLIVRGVSLLSDFWVNKGMLRLFELVSAQPDLVPGTYPIYEVLDRTPTTETIIADFDRAMVLNQESYTAHWGLGRAAMALGDAQTAADVLSFFTSFRNTNPMANEDLFLAKVYARQLKDISWFNNLPSHNALADLAALTLLDNYQSNVYMNKAVLEQTAVLRPDDLYVNYHLRQIALEANDVRGVVLYGDKLVNFSLEAVHPNDEGLLKYTTMVIPDLYSDGLWDRETTLRIASFLVWQHCNSTNVENLIHSLASRYSDEADWQFYLAELFHRKGDLNKAIVEYNRVLQIDPNFALVYLRLGMAYEAKSNIHQNESQSALELAKSYYLKYYEIAPDDLLGLEKLVSHPQNQKDESFQSAWNLIVDDQTAAAALMDLSLDEVRLGPNLLIYTERSSFVSNWVVNTYLGTNNKGGVFYTGEDSFFFSDNSIRMLTLRGGLQADETTPYAEYIGSSLPISKNQYVLSIQYSLGMTEGIGLIYFGDYSVPDGNILVYRSLPDSNNQLRSLRVLVNKPAEIDHIDMVPLIRNWGVGDLTIRSISLRPIYLGQPSN